MSTTHILNADNSNQLREAALRLISVANRLQTLGREGDSVQVRAYDLFEIQACIRALSVPLGRSRHLSSDDVQAIARLDACSGDW